MTPKLLRLLLHDQLYKVLKMFIDIRRFTQKKGENLNKYEKQYNKMLFDW